MSFRRLLLRRWQSIALGGTAACCAGAIIASDDAKNLPVGVLRFGRAAITVSKIVLDYKKTLSSIDAPVESAEYDAVKCQIHQRSAEKLLDLCCVNKGCFIKIGQYLGSLEYLLPKEYVKTLQVLHSEAPKSSLSSVMSVLEQELNVDPSSVFSSFAPEPVGAASLAQVHLATTHDGRRVAVKVQHKAVREHAAIDMKGIELLVNFVSRIFPEFQFDWLVEMTKENIPLELDFEHEGRNAERVANMFKQFPWLKIPEIDWKLSTSRVLTMEYCEGGQVNDREYFEQHGISPKQVSERLGLLYSEMIFCSGYVHSDPHPGNVLVRKMPSGGAQIILLDHGLYANVSAAVRESYSRFWLAILSIDLPGIKRYGEELGVGDMSALLACMVTARSWQGVTEGIDKKPANAEELDHVALYVSKLMPQIIKTLALVNRELLLLLKTNDLLRGIEFSLNIQHSMQSFLTMTRCCIRSVYGNQLTKCTSRRCRVSCHLQQAVELLKVDLLSNYLGLSSAVHRAVSWISSTVLGRHALAVGRTPGVRDLLGVGVTGGRLVWDTASWCAFSLYQAVTLLLTPLTGKTGTPTLLFDVETARFYFEGE